MEQLNEFIGNHIALSGLFTVLLVILIASEIKHLFSGVKKITLSKAVQCMNHEKACVIDLRSGQDFKKGHIQDAINIPVSELKNRIKELEKYRDKPIILACQMGQHSPAAGSVLKKQGLGPLYYLDGGINSWQGANLPLVS